ncbi:MAG: MarR family transcriptional regulator [Actinomycetota bacterium]|nr:MarR family transcriptional regulator [Actinomycetota bacterium]
MKRPKGDNGAWLSQHELAAWKGLQRMHARLAGALASDLKARSDLSLPDYQVLAVLSDAASGRLRAYLLADELGWEKSRLSRHLARMEQRRLVERQPCATDHRGVEVALSPAGRAAIEQAAPGHVAAVRRCFVDPLSAAQLAMLAEISSTVLTRLEGGPPAR